MRHAALILLCTSLAAAQPTLNLGSAPQPPAPGRGAAAISLAESLKTQADALAGPGDKPRARAALRRLARVLVTTGESAGAPGSTRILLGRTLARALPDLDRAVTSDLAAALLAQDFDRAAAALEDPAADPWPILREALATIAPRDATDPFAWFDHPPTPAPAIPQDLDTILSPAAAPAARDLIALAKLAEQSPAHYYEARHLLRTLATALTIPNWLQDPARRALADKASADLLQLQADPRSGLAPLARQATLASLATQLAALDDSQPSRKLRATFTQLIAEPPREHEPSRLDAFARSLTLALNEPLDEKALTRTARPAHRALVAPHRATQQKLVQTLPEILTRVNALSDPGIASTVAAHRRSIQDLAALSAINTAITGGAAPTSSATEPPVLDRFKRISDRLLRIGQDLSRDGNRDAALASLRALGDQMSQFLTLPGEDALRTPAPSPWTALTGSREQALLSEISDRRGGWLSGWDRAGFAGSSGDIARLTVLRDLLDLLADLAAITPAPGADTTPQLAALQCWPGWELSPEALRALTAGLTDQTAQAVAAITSGDTDTCAKLLRDLRQSHAAAILAGRLARLSPLKAPTDPILELASGGPTPESWMSAHAAAIADLCRYAEEIPAARALSARDRADALLKYVNARASEVLAAD